MQKLLIATSNQGKLLQYKAELGDLGLELISLKDLGLGSIEETGETFEENALLKARTYAKQSGLPCIADDGGLEIDYLNGAPGVKSRRWKTGDENVTDQELIDYTIEQMQGVPEDKRTARFTMITAFIAPDGSEHLAKGVTKGFVPLEASKTPLPHLPFDSVLFIPQFNKIRSELTKEEHDQINQRVQAVRELKPIIKQAFSIA